ncbi:MAG: M60 family metallopeptidase [Planctomycetes bacterium]|nr:M60 family metallopeptidase [Planctomycetota bacterium]
MSADEAEAICRFVEEGGGLLMAGLGWFWAQCNPTLTMEDFPLNVLGRRLGVKYPSAIVWEQSEKGVRLPATFQVGGLSAWRPGQTKVFKLGETTDQSIHAFVSRHKKTHNFAIEGEHTVLSLPAEAFLQLRRPNKAIADLDTVYKTHARLASNVPYDGKKISFVVVDRGKYHLCSGNPVLIRRDRVPVVLKDFNELGHPGWGLTHELGHDFVASAHKHAYQLGNGDNESWANVFTTHAYDTLKLKYDRYDTHWNEQRNGIAYYFAKEADYEQLKNDNWIMLSLLTVIRETYGWDPFYRFFKVCANKAKAGNPSGTEQEKVDFLVRELSVAAGVDFSSYFVRWGLPVSEAVTTELRTLSPAELDETARTIARQYNVK